ncbi:hypothetical protein BCR41DRAFT_354088 [Lobosporangium transversale]|uniref:Uncharacterized protein n=1 Tax=Lobosporangium transversale TaxID=64571 RepID=A0A1Y2GMJ6_9FUNG|nr:hypothetical protein BCR41DRAFT_354088 [Lobosporangium transversale]ORZ15569.1 hypothetical protein BCR41DRAFT_354088 [Lobosporangium transversale]|eukprot:XP_021881317.1 hypothetical protein BCR41DRAFT_354088 [Lobosporangium transversale]
MKLAVIVLLAAVLPSMAVGVEWCLCEHPRTKTLCSSHSYRDPSKIVGVMVRDRGMWYCNVGDDASEWWERCKGFPSCTTV